MYIQEVIIDGFKSYAQRTVVSGFDQQFNAITGLNGTGKSNILDAICFVLGISNLSQVRVGNLQELVYKQGQAGVTKATVTIVFNNADATTSPVGYESHKQITVTRQVVIGGKNKYMVNGHTVQQSQVQNLFHSVQLNVNNPHFLIMQGRITKVLNMKPPEILSMIEEAAGTRMFETKKQASIKTIEKKQLKVDEITKCIDEEITPTLESLRGERQDYHAWQANNTEFERLERFCIACDYKTAEEKVKSFEESKAQLTEEHDNLVHVQTERTQQAEGFTAQITEIARRRDDEMEGEMQQLKKTETELSKEVVKVNTLFTNLQESIATENESIKHLNVQVNSSEAGVREKGAEFEKCSAAIVIKEKESADAEAEYLSLRERFHNACAGVGDETNAELLSLPEQKLTWEKCERESASKVQQCMQRSQHVKQTLTELQKANKGGQSSSHSTILKEVETIREEISVLQSQLAQNSANDGDDKVLKAKIQDLKREIDQAKDQADSLNANLKVRLAFDYKDPEPRFDRARVKGLVAKLFTLKDANTANALEVVAGSKLTQVVVDTEQTGKLLLQNGQLRKRVTILPLSKISAKAVSEEKLTRAKQIATSMRGSATLALHMVSFDESVRKAMEFVFGSIIVCSSSDIAKAVAFDKNVRVKTVTMEGDSFDPAGTLTGGSLSQLGTLLKNMEELRALNSVIAAKTQEQDSLSSQLSALVKALSAVKDIKSKIEMKSHALTIHESKLSNSDYSQVLNQIKEAEEELASIEEELKKQKELNAKAKSELKTLTSAEKSITKQREQKMKEFEDQVKKAQKQASAIKTELNNLKAKRDALDAERKALLREIESLSEQKALSETALKRMTGEAKALEDKLTALRRDYERAKDSVIQKSNELNRCSKEIQALEHKREACQKEAQSASLEARKISHRLKQWDKDFKEAGKAIAGLLKQHPWIEREKAFFGQQGTDYDFAAKDVTSSYKRLKELKTEQDRLAKKINKKVMGMIENAEAEYEDLNRKRQVILNDKSKIESVIEELDVKKAQALKKTWQQVNRDFGSIFSMLLPGTMAKLEPPEGSTVTEGLEVKVAFNNVWKDSLTELSGGQRSLLALSLILALLLFKPAPMYILDEVDAALDLSHTQNIGMMIRSHFSSSQFIVVSLKEGMFNNANVIFRTRFVDGISAVTRTVSGARKGSAGSATAAIAATAFEEEDEEVEQSAPAKKKGKTAKGSKGRDNALEASSQLTVEI